VVPVYCATKVGEKAILAYLITYQRLRFQAFVKSFTLSLREQLRSTNINVVEISPPLVESDLHRDHANPDNNKSI
jgi:short-subunit dehydrogenase involved in D-alanine esterification of teichoic acids